MKSFGRLALGLLAAAASGVAMLLLFPPFHFTWLVWLVLSPLLVCLWTLGPKRRKRKAFGLGLVAGAVAFIGIFSWLNTVTPPGWLALSVYLGIFPALWAVFTATLGDPRRDPESLTSWHAIRRSFWVAAFWCGTEWLRGWLFTGFGWNSLGVAFHQTPVIAQGADLFGVAGLSFLPVFVQTTLVQAGFRLFRKSTETSSPRQPQYDLAAAALLVAATVGYGKWRISTLSRADFVPLKTLMVQLNIPQDARKKEVRPEVIQMRYETDTTEALHDLTPDRRPDWILWPEAAVEGRILRLPDQTWTMAESNFDSLKLINEEGSYTTIMGLLEMDGEPIGDMVAPKEDGRVWNSLCVFPPDGNLQTFRKQHLVIFGEWIPFLDKLPFLAELYEKGSGGEKFAGSLTPGESLDPLPVRLRDRQVDLIPTVCFEDSVGRLVRKFVRDTPQVIVNVTNDGWFKESIAAEQHFANARFRSIEIRRPLVRCANSGVTAAIDTLGLSHGQELRDASGKTFFRGHLFADTAIPLHPVTTPYARIGDWGVIAGALGSLLWAWLYARSLRPARPADLQSFG